MPDFSKGCAVVAARLYEKARLLVFPRLKCARKAVFRRTALGLCLLLLGALECEERVRTLPASLARIE